jgi:DNA-binding transcriptional regulator GbsR (MarR family)
MSDETRTLSPDVRQFIEDMGIRYEEEGFPPMAGRLAGWLLLCDPPHQTAGELADVLGASLGSISGMTRLLIQCGMVERVGVPGQRTACYRIKTGAASEIMSSWLEKTRALRELLDRGLEMAAGTPAARTRLQDQRDFHVFIERELPPLLEKWKRETGEGGAP